VPARAWQPCLALEGDGERSEKSAAKRGHATGGEPGCAVFAGVDDTRASGAHAVRRGACDRRRDGGTGVQNSRRNGSGGSRSTDDVC
jgi:hypothetical protein